ncbi:MAG: hypothetical protein ACRC8S_13590 [Fimbriiglobus sp.]
MRPQETSFVDDWKKNWNLMSGLAQIMAFPIDIFSTRVGSWGSRYLTFFAVPGCFWPVFFGGFCGRHPRLGDLFLFWFISLLLLLMHRAIGIQRRLRGEVCHSRYWGRSWLQWGTSLASDRYARSLDALLALGLGIVLVSVGSQPLGAFLMVSAVAKLLSDGLEFHATEVRVQEMNDARIEQEYYARLYREKHG